MKFSPYKGKVTWLPDDQCWGHQGDYQGRWAGFVSTDHPMFCTVGSSATCGNQVCSRVA
jgi:hypothetical protein